MSTIVTRRAILEGGLAALGLFALPMSARAQAPAFTHGVASGDPKQSRVTLWTRFLPADGGLARVRVEVALDPTFRRMVARHWGVAGPDGDHTVKVVATGLEPGRWYHYRFVGPDGSVSPVGRTRTLPTRGTDPFRIAVLSCANMDFGYFNAYRHLAQRDDIDLVLHLGDYIYEWGNGKHSLAALALKERVMRPAQETVTLDDYRTRYAWYRADPDLAEMHRRFPVISIVDDHEITNNAWVNGAGNHQPNEGPYPVRKAAAMRAYHEWLPMPATPYDRYDIGGLAAIFRLETRLVGRDEPLDLGDALKGAADPFKAMAAFRDGPLQDPKRTMMGAAQERWLADGLRSSVRAGQRWQIAAQQVVMGPTRLPETATGWSSQTPAAGSRAALRQMAAVAASRAGLPLGFDNWNGYPAARARLLGAAQVAGANLVVLSGDSHNAWAYDLAHDGKPAGVEFAGQSVASFGFEARFDADPKRIAADMVAANPALRWCDTSRRGYMTTTLTRDEARNDWLFLDTVTTRSTALSGTSTVAVGHGERRLQLA
ncbi:alkaline phosphatase D family protein [Sphingomonas sp.]|uniref:alkaline phosphatase D family protein n=1 Tax=Sphingomonas sp. TaxID=28214 RepID=UPI002D7F0B30|nr:alkaline phosphatase D family protein [Sphingomonas sp.]HEU0043504.1 alkaline phosphatase D family protein [Sphingomonas sp.]